MTSVNKPEEAVSDGWAAEHELLAYPIVKPLRTRLVPAAKERDWIPQAAETGPRWCLPLVLANSAGWELQTPVGITVVWDGGDGTEALHIEMDGETDMPATSDFGVGVLSFRMPYLFRTARGVDLQVRGPANCPKDGVSALEGLVETDWAVMTFTMNWQLTRPGVPVRWEAGEPVCMVVPWRRDDLLRTRPRLAKLRDQPETRELVRQATEQRRELRRRSVMLTLAGLVSSGRHEFERVYYRGRYPDGRRAPEHRAALRLRDFEDDAGIGPEAMPAASPGA